MVEGGVERPTMTFRTSDYGLPWAAAHSARSHRRQDSVALRIAVNPGVRFKDSIHATIKYSQDSLTTAAVQSLMTTAERHLARP